MRSHTTLSALWVAATLATSLAQPSHAADTTREIQARFRDQVRAEETGLPAYPGATPDRKPGEDGNGVSSSLLAGMFGVKLVVAKFRTTDKADQVLSFYREAMTRWGKVLDCNDPKNRQPVSEKDKDRVLRCDDTPPQAGQVYKVGTPQQQRLVMVQSKPEGTEFQVMLLEGKGSTFDFKVN